MASLTYDTLIAQVGEDLNRGDLETVIPGFISRLEATINARLAQKPVRPMVQVSTISSSDQSIALPDLYLDAISLTASDGTDTWALGRLHVEDLNNEAFYNNRALPYRGQYYSTRPQQYAIVGTDFYVTPEPTQSYDYTLRAYHKLSGLTATNTTNWLIDSHSEVYLFGTTAHAARYIRDDEAMRYNLDLFNESLDLALAAYPERIRVNGLRAVDAPWAVETFNINVG